MNFINEYNNNIMKINLFDLPIQLYLNNYKKDKWIVIFKMRISLLD